MAAPVASSSLMLVHSSSAAYSQGFNPNFLSVKPPNKLLDPGSLVLNLGGIRYRKYGSLYSPECFGVRSRNGTSRVVAAVSTEAEVAEQEVEEGKETGGVSTLAPPKPKKGKAALPLKRDRVRAHLSRWLILISP